MQGDSHNFRVVFARFFSGDAMTGGITARASAATDSGKTRYANQNETQAGCATHTRAEGGRLQPLDMRHPTY